MQPEADRRLEPEGGLSAKEDVRPYHYDCDAPTNVSDYRDWGLLFGHHH